MSKKYRYICPVDVLDTRRHKVVLTEPVEPGKFDRHIRKARRGDIHSRQQVFIVQSEADNERDTKRQSIDPAVCIG